MDNVLLRGNRTKKMNSAGLDAFESPNFPPLARLETGVRFRAAAVLPQPKGRFRVHKPLETNIAVWRMVPGFNDEYIQTAIEHARGLKAIVLELYGTGNLSSRKSSLIQALEKAISKGIVIVATSQCTHGTVTLRTYELGRRLERIGVISAADMTTEAAVCKLAYLLSWPGMTDHARLAVLMATSLRGEVTEQPAASSASMPVHLQVSTAAARGGAGALAAGYDYGGASDMLIGMESVTAAASGSRMSSYSSNNNESSASSSASNSFASSTDGSARAALEAGSSSASSSGTAPHGGVAHHGAQLEASAAAAAGTEQGLMRSKL